MNRAALLLSGMRAARRGGTRRLVAGALLFTAFVVYLLLVLFPGTPLSPDVRVLWASISLHPRLQALYLVAAATLVWAIWTLVGGAVLRATALRIADRPVEDTLAFCRRRWGRLFWAPLGAVLSGVVLIVLAALAALVVRVPVVGWLLLLVLSPLVVFLAVLGAAHVLRWLLSGHLLLPGIAIEGKSLFLGRSLAVAWLRHSPLAVVGLRMAGVGLLLFETLVALAAPALALGVLGWFVSVLPGDPAGRVMETIGEGMGGAAAGEALAAGAALVLSIALAAWYAAIPVCHRIGGRAALYLLHRRDIDGVPETDPGPEPGPMKSLSELGVTLVQRIRDEADD